MNGKTLKSFGSYPAFFWTVAHVAANTQRRPSCIGCFLCNCFHVSFGMPTKFSIVGTVPTTPSSYLSLAVPDLEGSVRSFFFYGICR